ncbi:Nin1 binding protein [Podochytrium sp. JEL0797]|nr:Nin1 binding protein [Podochytrium sp. JEL0797]
MADSTDPTLDEDDFQPVISKGKAKKAAAAKKHVHLHNNGPASNAFNNKTETLVADTAAFIKHGVRLDQIADEVVTIQEVLWEVRDLNARKNLQLAESLTNIKTRIPSDESVAAVSAFAKKTGDFAVLSSVDLKVLALTWMMEKEKNGVEHLRKEPMRPTQFIPKKQQKNSHQAAPISKEEEESISYFGGESEKKAEESGAAAAEEPVEPAVAAAEESKSNAVASAAAPESTDSPADAEMEEEIVYVDDEVEEVIEEKEATEEPAEAAASSSSAKKAAKPEAERDVFAEGEDDGWITPQNIAKIKAQHEQTIQTQLASQGKVSVGCITSDFAMQNVLLQMNLKLISVDGVVIKKAKSWIMRCHGCFKKTTDMTKVFCPACGNNTLMRTSCSVDGSGKMTFYLKRNYQYNLRGSKFSIPTPKGGHAGKSGGDMILREDQKEFIAAKKSQRVMQKKADYMDVDYVHFAENSSRGGVFGAPVVGHGKKNPNAGKGRRRK